MAVKMHDEIEILLEQFSGRIGRLTVLFDKLIEVGEVGFNWYVKFHKFDCKDTWSVFFANTKTARKSTEQQFSLVENRPTIRIGITIDIIVRRTFRIVTIVPLQSFWSETEISEGYRENFTTVPEWR